MKFSKKRCSEIIEKDGKKNVCGGMLAHSLNQIECMRCRTITYKWKKRTEAK